MQADHSVNGSCSPGRRKPRYGRTGPRLGRNHARTPAMYRLQCISAVGLDKILSSGGPEKMDLSIRKASRSDAVAGYCFDLRDATTQGLSCKRVESTIRYDTRCYFNVRSKADISQLNLPHGTDN